MSPEDVQRIERLIKWTCADHPFIASAVPDASWCQSCGQAARWHMDAAALRALLTAVQRLREERDALRRSLVEEQQYARATERHCDQAEARLERLTDERDATWGQLLKQWQRHDETPLQCLFRFIHEASAANRLLGDCIAQRNKAEAQLAAARACQVPCCGKRVLPEGQS